MGGQDITLVPACRGPKDKVRLCRSQRTGHTRARRSGTAHGPCPDRTHYGRKHKTKDKRRRRIHVHTPTPSSSTGTKKRLGAPCLEPKSTYLLVYSVYPALPEHRERDSPRSPKHRDPSREPLRKRSFPQRRRLLLRRPPAADDGGTQHTPAAIAVHQDAISGSVFCHQRRRRARGDQSPAAIQAAQLLLPLPLRPQVSLSEVPARAHPQQDPDELHPRGRGGGERELPESVDILAAAVLFDSVCLVLVARFVRVSMRRHLVVVSEVRRVCCTLISQSQRRWQMKDDDGHAAFQHAPPRTAQASNT